MDYQPKSIAEQIDCLARMTGAPPSFVDQVRDLFAKKGISLEEDSAPYVKALEEAFVREESIRAGAQRAQAQVSRLSTDFDKIGKAYVQQLERLRRVQGELHDKRREGRKSYLKLKPKSSSGAGSSAASGPSVTGRSLVTRQQNEEMPLVPGPEEIQ
jgi:hypothetical protein